MAAGGESSSSSDDDAEERERLREAVNSAGLKHDKELDNETQRPAKRKKLLSSSVPAQRLMKLLDDMIEYVDHIPPPDPQPSPPSTVKLLSTSHQPVKSPNDKNK